MFSKERVLEPCTPRAVYAYCPYEGLTPEPRPLNDSGADVGCLVDNIINSYSRTHIHPDDFVAVVNSKPTMRAKVRWPVDSEWSDAWVAQVVHMTSVDFRRAEVTVRWAYSAEDLRKLDSIGQLDASAGDLDIGRWARVLSDHTDVISSSSIATVLDISTEKSEHQLFLKKWSIKWDKRELLYFPSKLVI